ncbi:CAP domain-containing protein [Nonomuraea sp. NPDC047897]|uniref:CAP domain-containing protein n=1 Tax=Nonomuraea sp. NPDC047897 TaxID=3364346 RepID=UPI00370F88DB
MRRPLGVLACLVSVAAVSAPVATAHAAAAPQAECRLTVAAPSVAATGRLQVSVDRLDCGNRALVRVRLMRAVPGPDRVVRSGAKRVRDGRMTMTVPCAPGVYYATATDYRGLSAKSKAVRLACSPVTPPTASPTATSTASPTATPTATPTASPTATARPKPSATPTSSSTPPAGGVGTAEENEVVRLTNAERVKGGCQPLKHDAHLRKAAFGHSSDMATQNYFNHTSKDGRTFMDRIRGAGFAGGSAFAENIAMGQQTPSAVVTAWMNSSGHKANIMNCKYTVIGVGAAKNAKGQIYWTQNFAAR